MIKSQQDREFDVNKSKRRKLVVSDKKGFRIQAEPFTIAPLDILHRIVPTPFEVKDNYDSYPNINYEGKGIDFKYSIIDIRELGYIYDRLSKASMRVLLNMLYNLENDTNIVKFNIGEFARFRKWDAAFEYTLYKELIEHNLIVRTNKRCTYIINHNVFYKGDLNKFRDVYNTYYKNYEIEYNEKGEVITNFSKIWNGY